MKPPAPSVEFCARCGRPIPTGWGFCWTHDRADIRYALVALIVVSIVFAVIAAVL